MELNSDRWLDAHTESGTSMYTLTRCMTLADLNGDGDYKLIIADLGNGNENIKLKTFKGASLIGEITLLDLPSGVCSFFNETRQPRQPVVGVTSGANLFVYRNFKPYYKFSIPPLPVSPLECDLWLQARKSEISAGILREMLQTIQLELGMSSLSLQSQTLLNAPEDKLQSVVDTYVNLPVERTPVITCINVLRKNTSSDDSVSVLVCGCEHGDVYFIDPQAFTLIDTVNQPEQTVPVAIKTTGLYEVEYKIVICNRNGKITLIQRGFKMSKILMQLSLQPIDFALSPEGGQIYLINQTSLQCYNKKGRRHWQETLPAPGLNIISINIDHQGLHLLAVSLRGGTINLYKDRQLMEIITTTDNVAGMIFGRFGQEENCLILITDSGTFQIKILKRTAKFTDQSIINKQDEKVKKFQLPKRSKLFLEEIAREKANPLDLHQRFQRELFELRLTATEQLSEKIKQSNNVISDDKNLPIKMSAQIFGLGPTFKIRITLDNMGNSTSNMDHILSQQMFLLFQFNSKLYRLENPLIPVPLLVPGLEYLFETKVYTLIEVMIAEDMLVFLVAPPQTKPLLSAAIHIPICDVLPIDI